MFYDERIEKEKGKIAKRAILIGFIVTFVLAQIHCTNLMRNASDVRYYWFAFPDVVVYFSTVIALIVGLVRRIVISKDERTEAEQGSFYSKVASTLIKIALGAFAFDIPIVLYLGEPHTFADGGPGGKHAAVFLSLAAGLAVGALAQRTRLCMVGGIRDVVLFREYKLLIGFAAILATIFLLAKSE